VEKQQDQAVYPGYNCDAVVGSEVGAADSTVSELVEYGTAAVCWERHDWTSYVVGRFRE
jgi:hypothetical protein